MMPNIIAIHGPMAVGKSTITSLLRKKLRNYAYVDRPYIKRGLKPLGKESAKKISKDASYSIIRQITKLKKDMITEELSAKQIRNKIKNHIKKYNYKVHGFYLTCPVKEAKKREKTRAKKARPRLLEKIHKEYAAPDKHEQVINTDKLSAIQSVNLILKSIKNSN
jgi:adenylylsulfate kinase-like enzyme